MNAIVPINVTAIRVNQNDHTNRVGEFKGRTAVFERMPHGSSAKAASTGDMVVQPIDRNDSPPNPLGLGIHLHWELPDYFRRGAQPSQGGDVVFPQAPNRWLVIRYLSVFDPGSKKYGAVTTKSWVVESDFVAPQITPDADGVMRPAVSVPLPANPQPGDQPFMFMGRVLNYEDWSPAAELPQNYLPAFKGPDQKPLCLTSIGFVGPSFSAYYPECCSVFGFWDHFKDAPSVFQAISGNMPIQFRVSYQVTGWINEASSDPLAGINSLVIEKYNQYVSQCENEKVDVVQTPADVFASTAIQEFRWAFEKNDIAFTLNADKTLDAMNVPTQTLCSGIMQEVVWNMLSNPQTQFFLDNPANQTAPAIWTDTVELAVGNTTVEALSALLKQDLGNTDNDQDLHNYEYLLDALQLGLLHDLETQGNTLITLEENCHSKAFSQLSGGSLWIVEPKQSTGDTNQNADKEVTLPLPLAENLSLLNQAQQTYDQGRAALDIRRKQLFMDWIRYIKIFVSGQPDPNVNLNVLTNFLLTSDSGELNAVINYGKSVGVLFYLQDKVTAEVIGIQEPAAPESLAGAVWTQFQTTQTALVPFPDWHLRTVPATPFWAPTDPVVVLEGKRLEPVRRNGTGPNLSVRLSGELLNSLKLKSGDASFVVTTSELAGMPIVSDATPLKTEIREVIGEAYLLVPMLAGAVGDALRSQGEASNPAVSSYDDFVASLNSAQGGLSPFESTSNNGLFAVVHAATQPGPANPTQTVSAPLALDVTFTNDAANGFAPDAVAWNTQTALPEFDANRFDPFLPVFLLWSAQLDPLTREAGSNYSQNNLTDFFALDNDAIDYQYKLPAGFTTKAPVNYSGSITLSKTTTFSLTNQIDRYIADYPSDTDTDAALAATKAVYQSRKFISQGLAGFNLEQTLRTLIPKIAVEDLVKGARDTVTTSLNRAAIADPDDDWYDFGFNGEAPIATGLLPQFNFGPLRSGFAEILTLEIVDVFGQRMTLNTSGENPDGSLLTVVAASLKTATGDTANQGKIFLPPRLLMPTRLSFNWLSATHDNQVGGIASDFVEMNSHPATSPVCGWLMPNHLDNSLFFYDANGAAIGSFGVEHGDLKYRTRAGNAANPSDVLDLDIGSEAGPPLVNAHLAKFMWYIEGKDAPFLIDLMTTIENSDKFINPANFAQDASLAVLIGRPLALTRAVIGLETTGNLLPLSQADTSQSDPFPQDVSNNRFDYPARQQASSAQIAGVKFPLRLGDLSNIDDGLVGFLLELAGADPYDVFYSAAAPDKGSHSVMRPQPDTIETTLNAAPVVVTMLMDPRAPVHATAGILPVAARQIPPDQYAATMRSLAVSFFTHPVLCLRDRLVVPLPEESGYQWSWINPGMSAPLPLQPRAANEFAAFGYTPQTFLEGWLKLGSEETTNLSTDDD